MNVICFSITIYLFCCIHHICVRLCASVCTADNYMIKGFAFSKTGHLYKAGESVGIDFTGKCERFPNTLIGHQMLEYSKMLDPTMKIQNQVAERIFQVSVTR